MRRLGTALLLVSLMGIGPGCQSARPLARKEKLPSSSLAMDALAEAARPSPTSVLRPESSPLSQASAIPTEIDVRDQYASLVDHEEEGLPALPPQTAPSARPPVAMAAATRMPSNAGNDTEMASQRMRAMARRIQESSPERLEEFLKEVRQAAAQGNWKDVLASWDVALEFQRTLPPSAMPNSLSGALASPSRIAADRAAPISAAPRAPAYPEEPTARMTTVSASKMPIAEVEPEAPAQGSRKLSYRPAEDPPSMREPPSEESLNFASWAEQIEQRSQGNTTDPARWQVYSRLLHAMAGNTDQALTPIDGLDPSDRRFWRGYVYTLDRYFSDPSKARTEQRAAEAAMALRDSMDALSEKADLVITEPIFCRAVHSFGNYEEFDRYDFRAGEGVVVYWESRNFGSVESAEGYRTKMQAEFEIMDATGNRRHKFEQKFKDDVCQTRRHDYFNVVVFEWPRDLTPGEYVLKVTVTDLASQKVAEKQRKLRILP